MTPTPPPRAALATIAVVGSLLLLAAVWPDPIGRIPGGPLTDATKHAWSYAHTLDTLATLPRTTAVNAPAGGVLLDPMLLPSLLLAPLTALAGPALSANVWVVAMLASVALATAFLARELGADSRGQGVAAALGLLSQPLLAYPLAAGVHERLSAAVLPLVVAAALKRARTGRGAWLPALLVGPLALHCGVHAWLAGLLVVAVLPLAVARRSPHVPLHRVGLPWVVGAVVAAGFFALSAHWSGHPDSLAPQPGRHSLFGPGGAVVRPATLSHILVPYTPGFTDEGDLLTRGEHVGLGAILLVLWGARRRVDLRWIAAVAGIFVVWSLGPWPLSRLNWVYAVSVWLVPLLGAWPESGQLTVPAALLVAAGAGAALKHLPHRWLWPVVAVVVVERLAALPPLSHTTRLRPTPALTQDNDLHAIVTIPRQVPGRELTPPEPFRTWLSLRVPVATGIFPGVSAWDDYTPVATGTASDWGAVRRCLLTGGIDGIAFDRGLLPDVPRDVLQDAGAQVVSEDDRWLIVDLGTPLDPPVILPPFKPQGAAPAPTGWWPPPPKPVGVHTVSRTRPGCPTDG